MGHTHEERENKSHKKSQVELEIQKKKYKKKLLHFSLIKRGDSLSGTHTLWLAEGGGTQ